jgi:diguanylate cyclase
LKPFYNHVLSGVFQGFFGDVLMQFGIQIDNGVLIDLRCIPMMIAAQVGGWVATLITTTIIIISRLLFYQITQSSLVNILVLLVASLAFSFISYSHKSKKQKWVYMGLSFIVIIALTIHFVIPNLRLSLVIFVQYSTAIAVGTLASHLITAYLWKNRENYELLQEFAQKDHLTGLYNNRFYEQFLKESIQESKNSNQDMSLLMIDIDFFKSINDTYGHPAGDDILKQVSHILKDTCRLNDKVVRYGGEEFSIVMPNSNLISAKKLATRIQKRIEQNVFLVNRNKKLNVTVSIGYATINKEKPLSSSELIEIADKGLYMAKRGGRNQICHYLCS